MRATPLTPALLLTVALALLTAACTDNPVDPLADATAEPALPGVEAADLRLALDDVLVRVLPAINDVAIRAPLEATVAELTSALNAGDANRLSRTIVAAQGVLDHLVGAPETSEEHSADLSAVQLVLDGLASLPAPSSPLH